MGYEDDAHRIQDLFFEGKRDEAIMAVPEAFADEISLVGPKERIAERLEAWRRTPVTTLLRRRPGRADDARPRRPDDLTGSGLSERQRRKYPATQRAGPERPGAKRQERRR